VRSTDSLSSYEDHKTCCEHANIVTIMVIAANYANDNAFRTRDIETLGAEQ
jgi:hypothetical protein